MRGSVGILLLAVTTYFGWRWQLNQEIQQRIGDLRAAGLPVNWPELNDYYPAVPDDQNAALVLTQAFALRTTFSDARADAIAWFDAPPRTQKLTAEQRQLLSGYALLNEAAYMKVREALKLPKCRYPIDLSKGGDSELPHLALLKVLAQDIQKRALLDFNDHHDTQGTEALDCLLGLARTLEAEPTIISQLVRYVCFYLFESTLESALNLGQLEEAQLLQLNTSLEVADQPAVLANGLISERAMLLPLFDMGRAERDRVASMWAESWQLTNQPLPRVKPSEVKDKLMLSSERECLFFLDASEKSIQIIRQPPPLSLDVGPYYSEVIKEAAARGFDFSAAIFAPPANSLPQRQALAATSIRLSVTALAVERFHLGHGLFPVSLRVLVPEYLESVPIDPFDGKPLKYRRLDRGYVVYSVGPDRRDDGGCEPPSDLRWKSWADSEPYDITFIVER